MYAIVRTGGKQYQVAAGDTLRVEKLTGEIGDTVEISDVLLVADGDNIRVGTPAVEGAKVVAKIVEQGKAKKSACFQEKETQRISSPARSSSAFHRFEYSGNHVGCRSASLTCISTINFLFILSGENSHGT